MAKRTDDTSTSLSTRPDPSENSIAGVVELVKTYAKQETIEPIKNAGRFLGFGTAGALALGLGGSLLLLGLLRLFQTEVDRTARGLLSWLAYAIVLVVCVVAVIVTVSRISKSGLDHGGRPSTKEND